MWDQIPGNMHVYKYQNGLLNLSDWDLIDTELGIKSVSKETYS